MAKRIKIDLAPELEKKVLEILDQSGIGFNQLVNDALEQFLDDSFSGEAQKEATGKSRE